MAVDGEKPRDLSRMPVSILILARKQQMDRILHISSIVMCAVLDGQISVVPVNSVVSLGVVFTAISH